MNVLTVLTYYEPHWTGLTMIAQRIAEGLSRRGHHVTVLTTQHRPDLPREEDIRGVRVVRLRQVGSFSRGVVAPSFPLAAHRLIGAHDVVQIHTPLMEAPLVAALCAARRRPLLMTHQGDLVMPAGLANQAIERIGTSLLSLAGRLATAVTTHSDDYATHSPFLRPFASKLRPIFPPVAIPAPDPNAVAAWRAELGLVGKPLVGFAGRFVEEKGFDYLLRAVPALADAVPNVHLVYAGDHEIAYEDFFERCRPLIDRHRSRLTFVGLVLDRQRLADFYSLCDVVAVPSRSDCFNAVQLEAMLCGTPVVAADVPGLRQVVLRTGMGVLVSPRDPVALASALRQVLTESPRYLRPREEVEAIFAPEQSIDAYETLLASLAR